MFKFKSFNNKSSSAAKTSKDENPFDSSTNNNNDDVPPPSNQQQHQQQQKKPTFTRVEDSYKPVIDPSLTQQQRFQRELEQCAEDEKLFAGPGGSNNNNKNNHQKEDAADDDNNNEKNNNSAPPIDFDNFGKNYLESYGIKNGKALRDGGRLEQYAPKSIGGFATSDKTVHSSADLKIGDKVIVLPASASTSKPVVPISQPITNNNTTNKDGASHQQQQAPVRFVAEDDDDDEDELLVKNDPCQSQIGKTGAFIIRSDKQNVQLEFCGSGKRETFAKARLRAATEGESREIERIRTIRIQKVEESKSSGNNNGNRFGFGGGPSVPSNSANASSSTINSSWTLFPQLRVMLKKSSTENNQDDDDDEDRGDDGDDDEKEKIVTTALDNGKKAKLNSGETVSIDQVEPVPPQFPRTKAVLIRHSENKDNNNNDNNNTSGSSVISIGSLVLVEKIEANGKTCVVKAEDGKSYTIEKSCLCSTVRR